MSYAEHSRLARKYSAVFKPYTKKLKMLVGPETLTESVFILFVLCNSSKMVTQNLDTTERRQLM